MAAHAKDALRRPRIAKVLDLPLAVATSKAGAAEGLVAGQDGEILDLVVASAAAVCTVVTYQAPVTKQKEIRVAVEEGACHHYHRRLGRRGS